MKKYAGLAMIMMLLLFSMVPAFAQQVTAVGQDYQDVAFSNEFNGFCIDNSLKGAVSGDSYNVAQSTSAAKNNGDGSDISQKLKLLFTQCFEDIFISDGNGGYVLDSTKANTVLGAVYHYSDNTYVWGAQLELTQKVDSYTGAPIPDKGYQLTLANGDVVTFEFMVLEPVGEGKQSFFCYKVSADKQTAPDYSVSITTDGNGTVTAHPASAPAGESVTLTIVPQSGFELETLKVNGAEVSSYVNGNQYTFTMPAENVSVTVGFKPTHTCGNATFVSGQDATCTVDGWEVYYECSCGKLYADKSCQTEITDLNAWKNGAGKKEADHSYGELIPEVRPSHKKDELKPGVAAHYQCGACQKYFTVEKVETTLEGLTGAVPQHSYGGWITSDEEHWKECECGLVDQKGVHVYDDTKDEYCNICNYKRTIVPETYVITFNANGGSGAMSPQTFAESVVQNLTVNAFVREDHSFTGWNTRADGTGTSYTDGQNVTIGEDITLYAQWEKNAPVVYNVIVTDDGNGSGSAAPSSGVTGTAVSLSAMPNTGYRFKEWQVVSGGVTVENNQFTIGTADVEVKAIFEKIPTYTVTFNPNGGKGSMLPQTFTEETAQKLSVNTFAREGFTFDGWNTAADGSGKVFADGELVTVAGNVELYAQWKKVPAAHAFRIDQQPQDQYVPEGYTGKFTVKTTGEGLRYQWLMNRNDGRGWVEIAGANEVVYETTETTAIHDGFQYVCRISDRHGRTLYSEVAVLHVYAMPALPQTGDEASPLLWTMLILLSGVGFVLLRKKTSVR